MEGQGAAAGQLAAEHAILSSLLGAWHEAGPWTATKRGDDATCNTESTSLTGCALQPVRGEQMPSLLPGPTACSFSSAVEDALP